VHAGGPSPRTASLPPNLSTPSASMVTRALSPLRSLPHLPAQPGVAGECPPGMVPHYRNKPLLQGSCVLIETRATSFAACDPNAPLTGITTHKWNALHPITLVADTRPLFKWARLLLVHRIASTGRK
jgi:hypothetical protein